MVVNSNCRRKKTDKETQSPVLKIFRDIMQKEKTDPEKTKLLKQKKEDRRRKRYTDSKMKSDTRASESSGSDQRRQNDQRPGNVVDGQPDNSPQPYADKKESWFFWNGGCAEDKEKAVKKEDSCSCVSVSCALKKIVSSDYAGILCLYMLFGISVLVAFCIVFKTIPTIATDSSDGKELHRGQGLDSDSLKRKIDILKAKNDHDFGAKDGGDNWRNWGNSPLTKNLNVPGLAASDFGDSSLRESIDEYDGKLSGELSNVLDGAALSSDRLKDFYKKLIETDVQIRKIKKGFSYYNVMNTMNHFTDKLRRKRATKFWKKHLQLFKKEPRKHGNITQNKTSYPTLTVVSNKSLPNNTARHKRFDNETDQPTGFVVEEKKLIIEYKPSNPKPKFPKCSHSRKESKTHENQLKHPFYKNNQRLDELFEHFLYKNLPKASAETVTPDTQLNKKKIKTESTHIKSTKTPQHEVSSQGASKKFKHADSKITTQENKLESEKLLKMIQNTAEKEIKGTFDIFDELVDIATTPSDRYNVALSISTLNPSVNPSQSPYVERMGHRKLLQVDADGEDYPNYEVLNDIIVDDAEAQEIESEIKRQNRDRRTPGDPLKDTKYNPPGVINPNWKGPMPLYPDEINTMIKQAVIENLHSHSKLEIPNSKDITAELRNSANVERDNVDDYSTYKHERLVKMAQAYSDYGVLDGKKAEKKNGIKSIDKIDNRIKLASENATRKGIMGKMRNAGEKLRHDVNKKHNKNFDKMSFRSYIKYFKNKDEKLGNFSNNILNNSDKIRGFSAKQIIYDNQDSEVASTDVNDFMFPITRFRRSLKSWKVEDSYPELNSSENESMNLLKSINYESKTIGLDNFELLIKSINESIFKNFNDSMGENENTGFKGTVDNLMETEDKITQISNENVYTVKRNFKRDTNKAIKTYNLSKDKTEISNNTKADISDFLSTLSKWFDHLSILSGEKNFTSFVKKNASDSIKEKEELPLPMYDADMIENIGHRSRVLMAFEDKLNSTVGISEKNEMDYVNTAKKISDNEIQISTDLTQSNISTTDVTTSFYNTNKATVGIRDKDANTPTNDSKQDSNITKINVKRNADGNRLSWDDIYDDEYGVKTDKLEVPIREKHALFNSNDIVKRSGEWIQSKFMKIADNFRRNPQKHRRLTRNAIFGLSNQQDENHQEHIQYDKEGEEAVEDSPLESDKRSSFADLTANLKEVCHQAAIAVKDTKNAKVKEESKESQVATSLMQQVVKLMSDLVDIEVLQKTCRKLPPDLEKFLVWLTSSNDEQSQSTAANVDQTENMEDSAPGRSDDKSREELTDLLTTPTSEREEVHDSRSECLGTLRAVQDLIRQYHDMSDEDKSKMTGVKEYLEAQLEYLQKHLTNIDEYNTNNNYQKRDYSIRKRRDMNQKRNKYYSNIYKNKGRRKRTSNKFIKFGKKHTRSTVGNYDAIQVTEVHGNDKKAHYKGEGYNDEDLEVINKAINNEKKLENDKHVENTTLLVTDEEVKDKSGYVTNNYLNDYGTIEDKYAGDQEARDRRNLRDVYYKAVSDAKKFTTSKHLYKFDKQNV